MKLEFLGGPLDGRRILTVVGPTLWHAGTKVIARSGDALVAKYELDGDRYVFRGYVTPQQVA